MSAALESRQGPAEWQLDFMERVAAFADVTGLPPSHVRMLAWLVVCEPQEQSSADLRGALGLSAGAVSMATSTLERMGLIERFTRPGDRGLFYRFSSRSMERMLRLRLEATSRMVAALEDAIAHAPAQARLTEMHDMYDFFERSIAEFVEQSMTPRRRG